MISIIDDQGIERFLGNVEPPHGLMMSWPVYGDASTVPLIPRSEWPALIAAQGNDFYSPYLPYVHNQQNVSQCNCDAATAMLEALRSQQGLPFVKLSAADLYGRINGGYDRGSFLEDALRELVGKGVGTAATSGLIWSRSTKYASPEERTQFKILEAWLCPTFDHCMSAVLCGFFINSGIMWYSNYKPDADGWLPSRGSGGGGGHAVMGYKGRMRDGKFGIAHQNSWTDSFGIQGKCVFPETSYGREIGGCWAVRSVVSEDLQEIPAPYQE